jgi:hypothetical protein
MAVWLNFCWLLYKLKRPSEPDALRLMPMADISLFFSTLNAASEATLKLRLQLLIHQATGPRLACI